MYPIVVVLALGVAIAVERYIYLTAARATNQRIWKQVMPLIMDGNYRKASEVAEKSKAALGRILRYGLDRTGDHVRRARLLRPKRQLLRSRRNHRRASSRL